MRAGARHGWTSGSRSTTSSWVNRPGTLCGWALAHAHARSGDPAMIAGYLGRGAAFDEALATFGEHYADQNESDYAALKAAVEKGKIEAFVES